jgi:hypothetical protein
VAPLPAIENRALDALEAALAGIGAVPSEWLTDPVIAEGTPNDALPVPSAPHIFFDLFGSDPATEADGAPVSRHGFRVHFVVWIVGNTRRDVNSAKADILRAVFAGEGPITTAIGQPLWPGEFRHRVEMSAAGYFVASLGLFGDVQVDHATP